MNNLLKRCALCTLEKPVAEFSPVSGGPPGKTRSRCRSCRASKERSYRAMNGDHVREREKKQYHADVEKSRAEQRTRYQNNEEFRQKRLTYIAQYQKDHPECKQRYLRKLREEAVAHYGGACAVCAEATPEFLVLDHIADDGAAHRRALFGASPGGNSFYRKLRVLGYPAGLQVLCSNCNWRKERARRTNKSAAQTRYRAKIRAAIFAHYGTSCACCGESDEVVLTLDHINNDGAAHRKETTGKSTGAGLDFYRKMIRSGFPTLLRTLCWNCNAARGRFGYCPHAASTVSRPPLWPRRQCASSQAVSYRSFA